MSFGNIKVFPTVVAVSGASTSAEIDLRSKGFARLGVYIGTMSTGQSVQLYNAVNSSAASVKMHQWVNSGSTQCVPISIQTAAVENGGFVVLPPAPYGVVKFVTNAVISGGVSYTVVASD